MKLIFSITLLFLLLFAACTSINKGGLISPTTPLSATIESHGGKKYNTAKIAFDFRKKAYTFKNKDSEFEYTVRKEEKGKTYFDVLNNQGFTRQIDGVTQTLSEADATKYGNSLNSVIYFAQLPYKLDDPAVRQKEKGTVIIKGKNYRVIEISFTEDGGGTDHDDIFHYWVNQENDIIDYLAYSYHVNGGGVRFRSAYNQRRVGGILFQDYVNYKAQKNTPLVDLPALFEEGKLKELSKIELENIRTIQ